MTAVTAAAASLAVAAGALAAAALAGWTAGVDRAVLYALAGGPAWPWAVVTILGDTIVRAVLAAAAVIALLLRRRRADALRLAVAVAGGMALNDLLKGLARRPRPTLLPQLDAVDGWSLPSGHAAGAMALGLSLALLVPPRWRGRVLIAALTYAAVVGVSRIALAVHWPSDVAVGWLWGAAWALAVTRGGRSPPGTDTRAGSPP